MQHNQHELDSVDYLILKTLLSDASIAYSDIAKELNVSGGTIHVRMKKLQDSGIVLGTKLLINPAKLGFDICAFLGIYLEKGSAYRQVSDDLLEIDEIVELHYTTGNYNIFAKVICKDTQHLRTVLNDKIQIIPGVQSTETFISLEQSIHRDITLNLNEATVHHPDSHR